MVPGTYRELFATVAGSAGALTGLLFVALSVRRNGLVPGPSVVRQVRMAAALLAFTNALAVSLFTLVPGTNPGYPSVAVGVIGIFFTAAAIRSILASQATTREQFRQLGLIILLLLIFGTELTSGIVALASPGSGTALQLIGYALVASLLAGVARAWELVGERHTGLLASIGVLTRRTPGRDGDAVPGAVTGADPGGRGDPR